MAGKRRVEASPGDAKVKKPRSSGEKAEKPDKDTVFPRDSPPRKTFVPEEKANLVRVLSWNVNGLRAVVNKKKDVLMELLTEKPDVICLQETKIQHTHADGFEELFPGYKAFFSSSTAKKGYSGTAMFVRDALASQSHVKIGIGIEKHDAEGRSITLCTPFFNLIALYVPNSGQKLARLDYRTKEWDLDLRAFAKTLEKETGKPCVICGDLNVAHRDADLYNPTAKHIPKTAGCTAEERESFTAFLEEDDYIDSFRFLYPDAVGAYTYWSTRANGRPFNRGLRLDYFCLPKAMAQPGGSVELLDSFILDKLTQGTSDHCPVGLELIVRDR